MNERNKPLDHPNQPGYPPSQPSANAPQNPQNAPSRPTSVPGWQTVEFPRAIGVDARQQQARYTQNLKKTSKNTKKVGRSPSQTLPTTVSSSPPSADGLIALIQDANQRNHELMNRIAQLESALEESRQALQAEVDRVSETDGVSSDMPQELAEAQEQINYLLNQLEYAQQANQRQEILVATLTGQLQSSQERVEQLEEEFRLLQERNAAQATQLQQYECQCRDLHARLRRQQRYTLQFKAALEKCLEVPPPSYETAIAQQHAEVLTQSVEHNEVDSGGDSSCREPTPTAHPVSSEPMMDSASSPSPKHESNEVSSFLGESFFPRVQHIQPWSATFTSGQQPVSTPESNADASGQVPDPSSPATGTEPVSSTPLSSSSFSSKFYETLVELVGADLSEPVIPADAPSISSSFPDTRPQAEDGVEPPVEQNSTPTTSRWRSIMPPDLRVVSMVHGKADEALEPFPHPSSQQAAEAAGGEPTRAEFMEEDATLAETIEQNTTDIAAINPSAPPSASDATTNEDDEISQDTRFWNDLAQLINASTEDIVRAQHASTFDTFTNAQATSQAFDLSPKIDRKQSNDEPIDESSTQPPVTLPFQLNVPQQPQIASQDVTDDPWAIAPGSSPNIAKPEKKISSIPPLSVPPMDETKQSSLGAIAQSSLTPEAFSQHTEELVSKTPQDNPVDAPQEASRAVESSKTPGIPTLISDLSVVETLSQGVFGKGQEPESDVNTPLDQTQVESEQPSGATPSTPSSESKQGAAKSSKQELSPQPQQNPNWPSPLLYPMRSPAKTEKSNSAIELPAFLR